MVAVLFKAGDHTPEIPLTEVTGNAANKPPVQIAGTELNIGVTALPILTVTVLVLICPHVFTAVNVSSTEPVAVASSV